MGGPRPEGGRVRPDPGHPRPAADVVGAGHVLGDVVRALLLQVLQGAPAGASATCRPRRRSASCWPASARTPGVVDIGQGYAVTFKIESHNHPSYVEPYQGAATGVGGIVRDILAMGARPIGVMDPLRFGPLDEPDTASGAARDRRRGRRLRQLPGPAQHRWRGGLRPQLPGQPAGQRPVRRGAPARGPAPGPCPRRRQPGHPLRGGDRRRRDRRGQRAGQRDLRRRRSRASVPASRSATRSWRSC